MEAHTDHLDSEELLHLALVASQSERHDHAIALLKLAWQRSPDNADVIYCLGAEHAQIGMYERALTEMTHAIELRPSFDAARLQLGLLSLTCGLQDRAETVLQPLAEGSEDSGYRHYALALISLSKDDLPACAAAIEKGLKLPQANPELGGDMARLLQSLRAAGQPGDGGVTEADRANLAQPAGSLWLSSYKRNGNG